MITIYVSICLLSNRKKMRCIKHLGIVVIAFFMSGCNCHKEDETLRADELFAFLSEKQIDFHNKCIIILPAIGCGSCLSSAEHLLISRQDDIINNKHVILILTNLSDLKKFKWRTQLSDRFFKAENLFIDNQDALKFRSFYPALIRFEQDCMQKPVYQKPGAEGFEEKLLDCLKKKLNYEN